LVVNSFDELLPVPSDSKTTFFDIDAPAPGAARPTCWSEIVGRASHNRNENQGPAQPHGLQ
jgi:hypothetical protein